MEKLTLFDIQRFSYHDGPGIRTTVFLKGCNLRCFWCQNPESQSPKPELMYFAQSCIHCAACVDVCPQNALSIVGGSLCIDRQKCTACGTCAGQCPSSALRIAGRTQDIAQVLDTAEKDRALYEVSKGGLTVSGGEPLLQKGLPELLKEAKKRGLHTTVQTACSVCPEAVFRCAEYTDLFYCDIKTMDDAAHRRYCGVGNQMILKNIALLCSRGAQVMLRTPVIPGVNDSAEEMGRIGAFAGMLGLPLPVLLPFNKLGAGKYAALGRDYAASGLVAPTEADMEKWRRVLANAYRAAGQKGNGYVI